MLSSVGSYPLYNPNQENQTGNVGSDQEYECIASKSFPIIKSSCQSTNPISSDEKEWFSKSRQEHRCRQKSSTEPESELSANKTKYREIQKNHTDSIRPRMQLGKSQSSTQIKETIIQINQSCNSLDSLLNSQSVTKRSRSSNQKVFNKLQSLNGSEDCVVVISSRQTANNQKRLAEENKRITEKTMKKMKATTGEITSEIPKKKLKQGRKTSKRKPALVASNVKRSNSGKLLEMCYYKKYTGNRHQRQPINLNEENGISLNKKRVSKLNCTHPSKNISVACHKRHCTDKYKTTAAIVSSLDLIGQNFEETDQSQKLFKLSSEQEKNLRNQRYLGNITTEINADCTQFDSKHETGNFSQTFPFQRLDHKSKRHGKLTCTDKVKLENNTLAGNICSDNIEAACGDSASRHQLFAALNSQENNNDDLSKLFTSSINQDNIKLLSNLTAGNEDNYNLRNSFMSKLKQQIVKVAEKITPKDSTFDEHFNSINTLIIDDIKQQDVFKLFNISFVKNTNKLHKERRISIKSTNPLTYEERNVSVNGSTVLAKVNYKPHNLFIRKSTQKNNPSSKNQNKISKAKDGVNTAIKQKECIKFCNDYLGDNFDSTARNLNKQLGFVNNQQKTRKTFQHPMKGIDNLDDRTNTSNSLQASTNAGTKYNTEDNLCLEKTISAAKCAGRSQVNKLIIKVNSKSNYELITTSKCRSISALNINSNTKSCTKSKTLPKLLLFDENKFEAVSPKSSSLLNLPYVVNVKSVPKTNMEKGRPNSKFTTRNILLPNDRIYHSNKRMKRQLEELGMQNVLRTALATKCCKNLVLNENSQVDLPYKVSLTSLPSDATDINIVNKFSAKHNIKKGYDDFHNTHHSKLNYYSNLETSFKGTSKNTYEVRYFELKSNFQTDDKSAPPTNQTTDKNKTSEKKDASTSSRTYSSDNISVAKSSNNSSEYLNYKPPWGQSFEVRMLEVSDTDLPMAMSSAKGTNAAGTKKSKYYSYPDAEANMRNPKRGTTAERRPDEDFPRMAMRKTVEKKADLPPGPHQHGESRLGLEPWAPFSISDSSLPGVRKPNKANYPPYPDSDIPTTSSVKSAGKPFQNPQTNKESEISNQSRGVKPSQNVPRTDVAGLHPVYLTPELFEQISRLNQTEPPRVANANPLFKNKNIGQGPDFYALQNRASPTGNRSNRCPGRMCTVSTDTEDIDFEFLRGGVVHSQQQKKSSCIQCNHVNLPSPKVNRKEFTKESSQRSCTKQSDLGKTCTSGQPGTSKNQCKHLSKENFKENDVHKCGVSKDFCLCSYVNNRGIKSQNETELTSQDLLSRQPHKTHNHENKSSHRQDKACKEITDSTANQQRKDTAECLKCYNHNPQVMYYLGERRNTFSQTKSNSSDRKGQPITVGNTRQRSDAAHKSSTLPDDSLMIEKMRAVADTGTLHDPKQQLNEYNSRVEDSIIQKENIVQYCLDSELNKKAIPFPQKFNPVTIDSSSNKIIDKHHKMQVDKYYLLCLPNEASLSKENIFHEKHLPHTELITPKSNWPEQVQDVVQKVRNTQHDNISIMLQSHYNNKCSTGQKGVGSKKEAAEMYSDSTVYVFQTEPKLDSNKNSTNPVKQCSLMNHANMLLKTNTMPINEKGTLNRLSKCPDKQSLTENLKDGKFNSQTDIFQCQINKDVDEPRCCFTEQEKHPHKKNYNNRRKESNTFRRIYTELEALEGDCKYNTASTDSSHDKHRIIRNSTHHENGAIKRNRNRDSIENARDSVNGSASEQISMTKQCNLGNLEYSASNSATIYENFLKDIDWTQQSSILLKQFETAIGDIATENITNKRNEENKRSAEAVKYASNQIYKSLAKDNSEDIPVNSDSSKYSIILSQLADASTCATQNLSRLSPSQCLEDVAAEGNRCCNSKREGHSSKHCADTTAEHSQCYYDYGQQSIYSNKCTQSPPVVYRCKLSDFVKKSMQDNQFPNKFKLERKEENCDLITQTLDNCNENKFEQENCTNTALNCVIRSQQSDYLTVNKPKIEKSVLSTGTCNLVYQPSNNALKNIQKVTGHSLQPISKNDYEQCEVLVQYVDTSQQTEPSINSKVNSQSIENIYDKENRYNISEKQLLLNKTIICNNKGNIANNGLKTAGRTSGSAIPEAAVLADSNSETCMDTYQSRLFVCDSWLRFPMQMENKKNIFCPNPFRIPPDYDESEFNVRASSSRLSNCESFKDNSNNNISGKSSKLSDATEEEFVRRRNNHNIHLDRSSKDSKNYSSEGLREEYQKSSLPARIVPVTLAASQEECREASVSTTPVVLAISQEYQKVCPTSPIMLSEDCNQYNTSLNTLNCNQQQTGTELNKNNDKVYWALTKVKTHRDGSHEFEILETTPIPPGHFLIPTSNSVVLVGNQPCTSDEAEEV